MTAEKKYVKRIQVKTIGWVVEFRANLDPTDNWVNLDDPKSRSKKSVAIGDFNQRCKFHSLPTTILENRTAYRWLKYRGLARLAAVYVEVKDG